MDDARVLASTPEVTVDARDERRGIAVQCIFLWKKVRGFEGRRDHPLRPVGDEAVFAETTCGSIDAITILVADRFEPPTKTVGLNFPNNDPQALASSHELAADACQDANVCRRAMPPQELRTGPIQRRYGVWTTPPDPFRTRSAAIAWDRLWDRRLQKTLVGTVDMSIGLTRVFCCTRLTTSRKIGHLRLHIGAETVGPRFG